MHYIRCLRPPKVNKTGRDHHIELLFIISTDLGDSLLCPDQPIQLALTSIVNQTTGAAVHNDMASNDGRKLKVEWKAHQRVYKEKFLAHRSVEGAIVRGRPVEIVISVRNEEQTAGSVETILHPSDGLIMPLHLTLNPENKEEEDISLRKIRYGKGQDDLDVDDGYFLVGEDIGEPRSLARHVWDGGLVAASALVGSTLENAPETSRGPCIEAFRSLLNSEEPVRILELGCGVGVLGLGAAVAASRARKDQETIVLMTDLEDAEEQVRGNIARNEQLHGNGLELLYENLNWEDGRHGRFGPLLATHRWDLIMFSDCTYNVDVLPALVETLDCLHSANMAQPGAESGNGTSVFMATKPRHDSEEEVFEMLSNHRWITKAKQSTLLPVLDGMDQSVQFYLLNKSEG